MFAFKYPLSGDYITVYFDMKKFYFDSSEILVIVDRNKRKGGCEEIVEKMKTLKFVKVHQVIVLLDCFFDTDLLQYYILNILYPILINY